MRCLASTFLTGLVLWIVVAASVWGDWDDRFVRELRARQLWDLSREVCREKIDGSTTAREAARWTVEAMRTESAAALGEMGDGADAKWKAVDRWAEKFRQRFANSPWKYQVDLQSALSELARAEAQRMESELVDDASRLTERALEVLRRAERKLRALSREFDSGNVRLSGDDSIPPAVVQSIQNQVALARARVYWNRALCYAEGSDDRIAALEAANKSLDQLVRQTRPDDPVQMESLLWRARCLRELGDVAAAEEILRLLGKRKDLPAKWRLERDAELLELARRQHRPQMPLAAQIGRSVNGVRSPRWDLVSLRVLLDRLALSKSGAAQDLQQQIEQGINMIELVHGPYWGRRATRLMVGHAAGTTNIASATLLERSARERLGQQKWSEAVALLREAAEAASRSGAADEAFRLAYQAALLQQQHGELEQAAHALRSISLRWRKDRRAAQTHLLAIWSLARLLGDKLADDPTYLIWLDEQISVWPSAAATSRARLWMSAWLRARSKPEEALQVLKGVDWSSPVAGDAWHELFALWMRKIDNTPAAERAKLREELRSYFESMFEMGKGGTPGGLCLVRGLHRQLRLLLGEKLDQAEVEELQAWRDAEDLPEVCRSAVLFLLVSLGKAESEQLAEQGYGATSFVQLRWLTALWQSWFERGDRRAGERARTFADLIVKWLSLKEKVSIEQRVYLEQMRGRMLAAAGESQAARDVLQKLIEQYPRRVDVSRAWAAFLQASDERSDWGLAEQQWRRLANRLRPGSASWYQAKYGVAASLLKQGKRRECRERLDYLKATRGFGPQPWATKLQELRKKCD